MAEKNQNEKLTLHQKVNKVKFLLSEAKMTKSGKNEAFHFQYFELSDFLPHIVKFCYEVGILTRITFETQCGVLELMDTESDATLEYRSPFVDVKMDRMNPIQAIGAIQTYCKRYLYMNAFDIVENDLIDSITDKGKVEGKKTWIKENNTVKPNQNGKVGFGKSIDELPKQEKPVTESMLSEEQRRVINEWVSTCTTDSRTTKNIVEDLIKKFGPKEKWDSATGVKIIAELKKEHEKA